jgi:hypothetical protein
MVVGAAAFLASSGGFWVYLRNKYERKDRRREALLSLLMGLAHDKIVYLGLKYIEKGWVDKDEYDDLIKYFWEPYHSLGGNGSAERIVNIVKLLPIKPERREYRAARQAHDKLPEGTNKLIEMIERGEDDFERREQ